MSFFLLVRQKASDCDPRLQLALFDRVGCFLPASWRKKLHCGIQYSDIVVDELGRYDMSGLEELGHVKANMEGLDQTIGSPPDVSLYES